MDWLRSLQIERLGGFAQGHVAQISYAMATSLVVAISGPLNGLISRLVGSWNFFLRTLLYVVVFTVGYASLNYWSRRVLDQFLADQKPIPLLVLTFLAFLGFGLWAGQKRNFR
jgi:ABC-type amino acid transport system permease subunit